MRTLKLQMRITVDGFVADPEGNLDWMTVAMDEKTMDRLYHIADTSDTIVMGRKMSPAFLSHWEAIVDKHPTTPDFAFANKLVNIPKIIFSKTQKSTGGRNARMENGDLKTVIGKLKQGSGKDLLVYGGADFVSSLINESLIDDYYFIVIPVTLGKGMRIFQDRKKLELIESTRYGKGVFVNHYKPI